MSGVRNGDNGQGKRQPNVETVLYLIVIFADKILVFYHVLFVS